MKASRVSVTTAQPWRMSDVMFSLPEKKTKVKFGTVQKLLQISKIAPLEKMLVFFWRGGKNETLGYFTLCCRKI